MRYTKPEIRVLGDAGEVIQQVHNKSLPQISDAPFSGKQTTAAYDLDD